MRSYQQPYPVAGGYAMPVAGQVGGYAMPVAGVRPAAPQYQVAAGGARVISSSPMPASSPVTVTNMSGQPVQNTAFPFQQYASQASPTLVQTGVRPLGAPIAASTGPTVISASASGPRVISAAAPVQYQPQVLSAPRIINPGQQYQPQVVQQVIPQAMKPNVLAGPGYTQGSYEDKHKDDRQLQNLKELRKTCGLKEVPVREGLATMQGYSQDGKLSRDGFLQAYADILRNHQIAVPSVEIQNAVFDLFDRDGNHVVDMMELICGISLLCAGSEDDKIHAVFEIFDANGDGYISMDEMFKFLTSVFKVVLTPNVMAVMNSMGVEVTSAEDLSSVTSLECFKTADLNHDGKLSVQEFKNWFYAPRNDPSFLLSPVKKMLQ